MGVEKIISYIGNCSSLFRINTRRIIKVVYTSQYFYTK